MKNINLMIKMYKGLWKANGIISDRLKCDKAEIKPFIVFENEDTIYPEYSITVNENTIVLTGGLPYER